MGNMASLKDGALSLRRLVLLLTAMGVALLLASRVAHAAAPDNDNLVDAQQIIGADASITGENWEATKERYEPDHADNDGGKSVWYKWTPSEECRDDHRHLRKRLRYTTRRLHR